MIMQRTGDHNQKKEVFMPPAKYAVVMFILVLFAPRLAAEESYKDRYLKLLGDGRFSELKILLEEWEKKEPENPEMHIGFFNYYCNLDMITEPTMGRMPDGRYGFYNKRVYNKDNVYKGITYLDKDLTFSPNRLDIYWGKIELLFEIEDFNAAGETLFHVIEISPNYNASWALGDNKPVNNGKVYFLDYIYRYYDILMNAPSNDAATALIKCTKLQMKLYPESTFAYNILAVYYILQSEYETALDYLLAAEKADGTDCIILINIGRLYAEMKNNVQAKDYLDKVIRIGSAEEKRQAQYYIDQYNL
jgi:hypothetical protein